MVLTPPPVTDPGALVVLAEIPAGNAAASPRAAAYSTFEEWRARAAPLASMEAFDGTNLTLTELGAAERLQAMNVTTGFLALLGASPALGRTFAPEDDGLPLVVISHAFWRSRLGGAQSAVGQQIVLGGQPHTVVGVLPERFTFGLETANLWRPFPAAPGTAARAASRVSVVARLGAARVAADLAAVLDEVSGRATPPSRVIATPFATAVSGRARAPLAILAGAAAFALFVAFTNLAGLLMVRAMDRRRELAVRTALGARRFEIARQLLLEALVLAAAGVAGGLLLALWTTPAVGQLAIEQFGGSANRAVEVNGRGIATVSLLAFVCAGFCGAAPAFAASRPDVVDVLRRGATAPPRDRRLRRVLVAGEVAVAFVLLVSLALLGRSLLTVSRTNPGFDPEDVLTLQVSLPSAHYDSAVRVTGFYASLRAALTERLGAGSASIVDEIPLSGGRGVTLVSAGPTQAGLEAMVRSADVAYFDVMRIPILSGRGFDLTDTPSAPPRAVISESLASALFPGESPIGRRVRLRPSLQTADIIGVVGDVRQRALDEPPTPAVYLPGTQAPSNSSIVVVRSQRPDARCDRRGSCCRGAARREPAGVQRPANDGRHRKVVRRSRPPAPHRGLQCVRAPGSRPEHSGAVRARGPRRGPTPFGDRLADRAGRGPGADPPRDTRPRNVDHHRRARGRRRAGDLGRRDVERGVSLDRPSGRPQRRPCRGSAADDGTLRSASGCAARIADRPVEGASIGVRLSRPSGARFASSEGHGPQEERQ